MFYWFKTAFTLVYVNFQRYNYIKVDIILVNDFSLQEK